MIWLGRIGFVTELETVVGLVVGVRLGVTFEGDDDCRARVSAIA
jgi:hypothetical protein